MSRSELVQERAQLLARVEEINLALKNFDRGAIEIHTSKNIRNSPGVVAGPSHEYAVSVYMDEALTKFASSSDHGGWVSGDDAAWLIASGYKEYVT